MSGAPIEVDLQKVAERVDAGETVKDIAAEYGLSRRALSNRLSRARARGDLAPKGESGSFVDGQRVVGARDRLEVVEDGGDRLLSASVEVWPGQKIRTLEDLIAATATDLESWRLDKHELTNWPVTMKGPDKLPITVEMLRIHAKLSARGDIYASRELAAELVERMRGHSPTYSRPAWPALVEPPFLLEVALADVHVGEMGSALETGEVMTLERARRLVPAAVRCLAERAASSYPVGEILLFLGGDFLHADRYAGDGSGGKTTRGTVQDLSARLVEVYRAAFDALVESVDALRMLAPVKVVARPGNHDELLLFTMADALAAWYRLDDAVQVVNDAHSEATVVTWGESIIGLMHGHKAKDPKDLALMLADLAAEAWAGATWREIHRGHTHALRVSDLEVDEVRRVRLRTVPGLAIDGPWAAGMGWRHVRAAEAYLWGSEPGDGMVATFSTTAGELERRGLV